MAMDQAYGAGGGCFRLAAYRHPRKAGQLESQVAERLMAAAQNQRNFSTNRNITEYEATHPKELGKDVGRFGRKREEEFRAMALDGYLPAYVALRLFDLQWGKRFADKQAALMLLDAGENGDVS